MAFVLFSLRYFRVKVERFLLIKGNDIAVVLMRKNKIFKVGNSEKARLYFNDDNFQYFAT